jgi:acyl-CoA reductase-like NAD-dependent aldehyde dehydrogenase
MSVFSASEKKLFINNQFVESVSQLYFPVFDPCTGKQICQVARAGPQDIDIAVIAAREAFEHGPYSKMEYLERRDILLRIADNVMRRREEVAHLESLDTGKPFKESLREVDFAANIFRYYAGWADKINGKTLQT